MGQDRSPAHAIFRVRGALRARVLLSREGSSADFGSYSASATRETDLSYRLDGRSAARAASSSRS